MKETGRMLLSVLAAAVTFLILFLAAGWNLIVSAALCVGVYFGFFLLLKTDRKIGGIAVDDLPGGEVTGELLAEAKKDLAEIRRAGKQIADAFVRDDAERLYATGQRILSYLEENPEKIKRARRFFTYYLDTAARLLSRYLDFQETGLRTEEVTGILDRTARALPVLNRTFEKQFTRLMAGELMDVEADISLLEENGSDGKKDGQWEKRGRRKENEDKITGACHTGGGHYSCCGLLFY